MNKTPNLDRLSESENAALNTIVETLSMFTQHERYKILAALKEYRSHWFQEVK